MLLGLVEAGVLREMAPVPISIEKAAVAGQVE
jgi:hypothetical protein